MRIPKKRKTPSGFKSALAGVLCACLLLGGCSGEPPPESKEITITDSGGNILARGANEGKLFEGEHKDYIAIVYEELLQLFAKQNSCSTEEAKKLLFSQTYQIKTAFDPEAYKALNTIRIVWQDTCEAGAAITDLQGNLLAVISVDPSGGNQSLVLNRRPPCSAFKALSVYAPAVEKGVVNWSTLYEDTPYKQITENGNTRDWPANASGSYSNAQVTVADALKKSLNTVAVKCLKDVGVGESIAFLQNRFGIPLTEEAHVLQSYGAEEVLGSMALGYPETGVTPVEMAGYYQVFANGGIYTAPRTVLSVTDEGGQLIYQQEVAGKQAIRPETADIMNKLLQGVVAAGGTGEKAASKGIDIAGKTGTGDNHMDNWFVGVTASYSLAIWHGEHDANDAGLMFRGIIEALYTAKPQSGTRFVSHTPLKEAAYCKKSGKALSPDCTSIQVGFYTKEEALPYCDKCGKEVGTK